MKYTFFDRTYQISIVSWGIATITLDIIFPHKDIAVIGLAGIISTMIIYGTYLVRWDNNEK